MLIRTESIYFNNNTNKILFLNNTSNPNSTTSNITQNEIYYIKLFHNILGNIFSYYNQGP